MRFFLLLVLLLLTMGCVREYERKPAYASTTVSVSREKGRSVVSWNSDLGKRYAVVYRDSKKPGERWKPYPGASQLVGTGNEMKLVDESPGAFYRGYMVRALVPVTKQQLQKARQTAR